MILFLQRTPKNKQYMYVHEHHYGQGKTKKIWNHGQYVLLIKNKFLINTRKEYSQFSTGCRFSCESYYMTFPTLMDECACLTTILM